MDAANLNQIIEASGKISGLWQFLTFIITAVGIPLAIWLADHWVKQSKNLEKEQTKNRVLLRDKQMNEFKTEMDKKSEELHGLGKSFDRHINDHKDKDFGTEQQLKGLDIRLQRIEMNLIERKEFSELQTNIHNMDKHIVKIMTILDERFQKAV